jgi:5'-AMP-activated protein kinase catalytic alpha subunit
LKSEKQVQSVKREVRLLFLMNHPHIVDILDVIETSQQLFIVMEYMCRGELFDHIVKNRHLTEIETRRYMHQIVSAVEYMHEVRRCSCF